MERGRTIYLIKEGASKADFVQTLCILFWEASSDDVSLLNSTPSVGPETIFPIFSDRQFTDPGHLVSI